jgi:uncharacterized protein DUF2784
MLYRGLAVAVALLHFTWLAFIPAGGFLAWRWPGVLWAHLPSLALALTAVTVGFDCPLTIWEKALFRRAGERPYAGGFIDHYVDGRLFPHGWDRPVQLALAVAVVAAYARLITRSRGRSRPWNP